MIDSGCRTSIQSKHKKSIRLILTLLILSSTILFISGCDLGVAGTYHCIDKTITISSGSMVTSINEFTLHEDGSAVIEKDVMFSEVAMFSPITGTYTIDDTCITFYFNDNPLVGTIENGSITFDTQYDGQVVFERQWTLF